MLRNRIRGARQGMAGEAVLAHHSPYSGARSVDHQAGLRLPSRPATSGLEAEHAHRACDWPAKLFHAAAAGMQETRRLHGGMLIGEAIGGDAERAMDIVLEVATAKIPGELQAGTGLAPGCPVLAHQLPAIGQAEGDLVAARRARM